MPTYVFVCTQCKEEFEHFQPMSADDPACPACGASVKRRITAGAGVIMRSGSGCSPSAGNCAYNSCGATCCGAGQPCGMGGCGGHE